MKEEKSEEKVEQTGLPDNQARGSVLQQAGTTDINHAAQCWTLNASLVWILVCCPAEISQMLDDNL